MSDLKPVAWTWEYNGTQVTADKSLAMSLKADGVAVTPLYAIPDGYALMPVEECALAMSGSVFTGDEKVRNALGVINGILLGATKKGSVVDEEV